MLKLVESYIPDLVSDNKGGSSGITAGELRLAELAAAARVSWLLALAQLSLFSVRIGPTWSEAAGD